MIIKLNLVAASLQKKVLLLWYLGQTVDQAFQRMFVQTTHTERADDIRTHTVTRWVEARRTEAQHAATYLQVTRCTIHAELA